MSSTEDSELPSIMRPLLFRKNAVVGEQDGKQQLHRLIDETYEMLRRYSNVTSELKGMILRNRLPELRAICVRITTFEVSMRTVQIDERRKRRIEKMAGVYKAKLERDIDLYEKSISTGIPTVMKSGTAIG
jgi:hypothetical protein